MAASPRLIANKAAYRFNYSRLNSSKQTSIIITIIVIMKQGRGEGKPGQQRYKEKTTQAKTKLQEAPARYQPQLESTAEMIITRWQDQAHPQPIRHYRNLELADTHNKEGSPLAI